MLLAERAHGRYWSYTFAVAETARAEYFANQGSYDKLKPLWKDQYMLKDTFATFGNLHSNA